MCVCVRQNLRTGPDISLPPFLLFAVFVFVLKVGPEPLSLWREGEQDRRNVCAEFLHLFVRPSAEVCRLLTFSI